MDWVAGIDVAKDSLCVSICRDTGEWINAEETIVNAPDELDALHEILPASKGLIAYEASGGYERFLKRWIDHHPVYEGVCLNPFQVKSFAESQGTRTKTDPVDARTIATFARMNPNDPDRPSHPAHEALKGLTRHVEHLKKRRRQELNYRESLDDARRRAHADESIEMYDRQLEEARQDIQSLLDDHPELDQNRELLTSIPGIGQEVAILLLAELQNGDRPEDLDPKQEVANAGLDPRREQSGTSLDRSRLSKRGNPRIRKALYFPTLTAIRYNPVIKAFYERLLSRGKVKMVAICASMRKLLHLAVGVLKNQAKFDPQWEHQKA